MLTEDLRAMSANELSAVFREGTPVDKETIIDAEYLGVSLGLPAVIEQMSWTTFMKVFYRDGDVLRGWNVRLEQTGIGGPVRPQRRFGKQRSFGHFAIRDLTDAETRDYAPAAVMLDYGAYFQPPPMFLMRDPVVSLDEGAGHRLLGYSYGQVGTASVATPSYFVLERRGPIEFEIATPRWPREY